MKLFCRCNSKWINGSVNETRRLTGYDTPAKETLGGCPDCGLRYWHDADYENEMFDRKRGPFDRFLYVPYEDEIQAFGENWCGPKTYQHGVEALVAEYPKQEGGDGQSTKVYCTALPARFYTIKVESEPNSIGLPQAAYQVSTGSSWSLQAALIAEAIADGMLKFEPSVNEADFAHDVFGIMNNLDRDTGKLQNCCLPRYSLKQISPFSVEQIVENANKEIALCEDRLKAGNGGWAAMAAIKRVVFGENHD